MLAGNFPFHDEQWRRSVEALILELEHDVRTIQQTAPPIPDPEAGNAFTGPLEPQSFVFPRGAAGGSGTTT